MGNRPGSLTDITDAIATVGINVQSLAVGSSEQPGRSRITVVIPRDTGGLPGLVQQVGAPLLSVSIPSIGYCGCGRRGVEIVLRPRRMPLVAEIGFGSLNLSILAFMGHGHVMIGLLQIEGLDIVSAVTDLTETPFVARELMIIKVRLAYESAWALCLLRKYSLFRSYIDKTTGQFRKRQL